MKILDRYILTTYLKTFMSVFIILIMIFILQTIWLYIKELAGKDLDIIVVAKFLIYFMPKLIPLVLPLTILLSSIMVFGSFAENYEFAAMKSTGISLQRAMSGLSVFIVILGITTFFFSNNVIPWAEYNSYNLRRNIAKLKPGMAIAEGQFTNIGDNYNIKVKKKSGDRGQYLEDVIIHKKGSDGRTNAATITSKTGELVGEEKSNVVKLILFDGNYYEDISKRNATERKKHPFAKASFEKYDFNIDLTEFNKVDLEDKSYDDRYNMLNIRDLDYTIDSLIEKQYSNHETLTSNLYKRSNVYKTTPKRAPVAKAIKKTVAEQKKDSIYTGEILELFDTKAKTQIVDVAQKSVVSTQQLIKTKKSTSKIAKVSFNRHIIALHEKFALGFACIILFFVGAPLGALIRKGGIGLPMVIAILLFLTYHFIGIFATNSAKNGSFNPILASWFSTLVMLPLGIFLTKRATADKGLFDLDSIIEPLKKVLNIKEKNSVDYKFLNSYTNDRLIDLIINYETQGHEADCCFEAIKILNYRGISTKELIDDGLPLNKAYLTSETIVKNYKDHTKFSILLYGVGVVLLILFFVFRNNKLPSLATASIQLSLVSLLLFVIYYIKSLLNMSSFYKHMSKGRKRPSLALLIIGFPLYMISYVFLNAKIKEDLKFNCLDSLK
ncbi:LptF/LptG family permease [Snuella sedimenti]|uniref:LptF/LptG family permease n=1 Tax=Snuella sedimenti TaxID=2798802 RepID=A0A8J7J2W1_9FLAO|nr:LptF/LptG family permease [Snuella sedimenti]MBJ6367298.1 LptF/LptG family permease [Snuella sedimenti]